ncbi:MAG: 2-oxoacid:acceptor oxidoreductase subunit alpha, partial [Anaerolineae bacterium]|nr:2-oxoacid:acceptor oxidoreductase subunit alpha [Anaerolineae bacterium]
MKNKMSILIGGEAGQGVESSGAGFAKAIARSGLHIFALQDYMSRIRGGHNFFKVRISEEPLYSHADELHLIVALNLDTIEIHYKDVSKGGGIIYDETLKVDKELIESSGVKLFPVPLTKIAKEFGNSIMANTAALGAVAGLVRFDLKFINGVVSENFIKKGDELVNANLNVAKKAYKYAKENYADYFDYILATVDAPDRMVINGNEAIGLGALLGGVKFISAYPMTPATSLFEWLTSQGKEYGIVSKHTEDEIAAITMAIGASHAGVRAMTSTSGGGFSLMVEALGMAGITETPIVIAEVQRAGPSTGMPTRTEQADLLFLMNASHGEFPRIILAPGTVEEAFEAGWRAFNLAEKYQCPVLIMSDTYLANSLRSIESTDLKFDEIEIDRGKLMTSEELDDLEGRYLRYKITPDGISPRAIPGHPNGVFMASSDEHTEDGHFEDEDPANRIKMVEKRAQKMIEAQKDINEPSYFGEDSPEILLVGWGSSYGPIRETVERINSNGKKAAFVHFSDILPFTNGDVKSLLKEGKKVICVENNSTGQFAQVLRAYAGVDVDEQILRYDG